MVLSFGGGGARGAAHAGGWGLSGMIASKYARTAGSAQPLPPAGSPARRMGRVASPRAGVWVGFVVEVPPPAHARAHAHGSMPVSCHTGSSGIRNDHRVIACGRRRYSREMTNSTALRTARAHCNGSSGQCRASHGDALQSHNSRVCLFACSCSARTRAFHACL